MARPRITASLDSLIDRFVRREWTLTHKVHAMMKDTCPRTIENLCVDLDTDDRFALTVICEAFCRTGLLTKRTRITFDGSSVTIYWKPVKLSLDKGR